MAIPEYRSVLRNRNLQLVFAGQFLTASASGIFDITLIWFALDIAESYASVGALIFLRYIPYVLFGLIGGWLSDRLDRRWLIVISSLARAALLALLAAAISFGGSVLFSLAIASFLLTVARTFFQPALQGLLPQLAPRKLLVHANAVLHGLNEIAGIVSPFIGGLLLLVLSAEVIFALLAGIFLAAALLAMMVRYRHQRIDAPMSPIALLEDYRDLGRLLLAQHKRTLHAILFNAIAVFGVAGVLSLLIPMLVKERFADGPETLGILMGAIGLGTVVGAYATARIVQTKHAIAMYAAWITYGLLTMALGFSGMLKVALLIGFVLGMGGAVADILFATIVQSDMPSRQVSKTFALFSTLANLGEAVSAPFLVLVLGAFGLSAAFWAGGAIAVGAALAGLWSVRSSIMAYRGSSTGLSE